MSKIVSPFLGWNMCTMGSIIDYLNKENGIGKKKMDYCIIKFKGERWKLKRMEVINNGR